MSLADELPPYVHKKIGKGRPYYYYNMRRVGANKCQLVRLPDISDPQFERRLNELHYLKGLPPERRTKAGARPMVYFIGASDGPIKIGTSVNPTERCANMQTGMPDSVKVLAVTPGGRSLERAYHERFGFAHLRGEWFERRPEIVAEIERLNGTGTNGA